MPQTMKACCTASRRQFGNRGLEVVHVGGEPSGSGTRARPRNLVVVAQRLRQPRLHELQQPDRRAPADATTWRRCRARAPAGADRPARGSPPRWRCRARRWPTTDATPAASSARRFRRTAPAAPAVRRRQTTTGSPRCTCRACPARPSRGLVQLVIAAQRHHHHLVVGRRRGVAPRRDQQPSARAP